MRFFQDSDSEEDSDQAVEDPQGQQTQLQEIISINVTIFNDIGFLVSEENFSRRRDNEYAEEFQEEDSDSERSQFDYGDSYEQEGDVAIQVGEEEANQQEEQSNSRQHFMLDQQSVDQSNNQSPFFPQIARHEGLSAEEISAMPTMQWSYAHNIFNRGEKCPVCLQEFTLGNMLRVMECLHRFHTDCLDQWLSLKASCPSCRSPHNRQTQ